MKLQIFAAFLVFSVFYSPNVSAQIKNVQINNPASTFPEEVTIAINRQNPSEMAAGANINFFYNSTDNGKTWAQNKLTSTFGVWGDPCVIYDTTGNLYYAHLSNPSSGYWIDRIVVQKSTDNGMNWDSGYGIGLNPSKNQDKEWMTVNRTNSPQAGNIYLSWTEFDKYGSTNLNDSTRILFSRTTDEGATWSKPVRISDVGGDASDGDNTVEGAVPTVGPDGTIYVSWAGPLGLVFNKSTDGGLTFGNDKIIASIPGGWDFEISGISRANGMPITACDISNSQYRGNIYINWSDQRNGTDNTDIFFIKSTDGGKTWSDVIQVNNDFTFRQQFFTWMSVDETSGNIYIVFYDRRTTVGNYTDVYLARSTDGGETFKNYQINKESFLPDANVFFGDYINVDAYNGIIRPIWMSMNNGELSVWTALLNDSLFNTSISGFHILTGNFSATPTWNNKNLSIQGFEIERKFQNDINWSEIKYVPVKNDSNYYYLDSDLPEGEYSYRIKQINPDGSYSYSGVKTTRVSEINSVAENNLPNKIKLYQNYPNPFNPTTVIEYSIPVFDTRNSITIQLEIYDILGRKVATLINEKQSPGNHSVQFNAENFNSGVYFYKLKVGNFFKVKKMTVLK